MGKEKNKKNINKSNLIMCEGEDTTQFIIKYLTYLQKSDVVFENFLALDFGGNEELPTFLLDLPNYPGFDIVKTIIIVRDAECNHDDAVKSVKSALDKSIFPAPSKTGTIEQNGKIKLAFTLFPALSTSNRSGALENLYIENLNEIDAEAVIGDIRSFLCDLKAKDRKFIWYHKTMLHTYFSVTNDFVSMKIGQATEAGAFNFECDEMNMLKDLMYHIIKYEV